MADDRSPAADADPSRRDALTRAARAVHASLDLDAVLSSVAREAAVLLDAEVAAVYRGSVAEGVTIVSAHGLPPEMIGFRLATGEGVAGRVLETGRTERADDYAGEPLAPGSPFVRVHAAIGVPLAWSGEPRGVLAVGWERERALDADDAALLESFAALAETACANASAHAAVALAARTDALTGCLNHAALHEGLRREIERARRGLAAPPSLVLFDLDAFNRVNERHGHALGDEVLRRVGHGLRTGTREYDLAARYGGDEFALVCVEATEGEALEVARRALERVATAIGDLGEGEPARATAGVAEWAEELPPGELLNRAGRALAHGKREGGRGDAHAYSQLPDWFRPGRFGRTRGGEPPVPPPTGSAPAWPQPDLPLHDRLRARARGLAAAADLGARLAILLDEAAVVHTATDALREHFGWSTATLTPRDEVPPTAGDAHVEVPVHLPDGTLWGALVVDGRPPGHAGDAAALLETVAAQVGAALEAARRHARAVRDREP